MTNDSGKRAMGGLRLADPTWWRRLAGGPHEGDLEQQDGRYRLSRVRDPSGSTLGWVLYVDGVAHEQRELLRDAKSYALALSKRLIGERQG